jgi:hypothetical protein
MQTTRTAAAFLAIALLASCGNDERAEVAKLRSEVASLRAELGAVSRERDDLKFGPARLLAEAESLAASSKWAEAKGRAEALVAKHPTSPEAPRAQALAAKASTAMAAQEREAAAAEQKRLQEERRQKEQEEGRLAAALSKMHKKVDQIENVTWYRDQSSPRFSNYNGFFLYVGKKPAGDPWLRLRVQYNADTWLFIESFLVVADGRRFEYNSAKFDRDNSSEIWEWYDENADTSDLEMIRAIIESKSAVIRFNGRQYRRDRTITAAEKAALKNVLDAYKVLGGT